jgi:hypothetical protein
MKYPNVKSIKNKIKNIHPANIISIVIFAGFGTYLILSTLAAPVSTSNITAVKTLGIYPGFGNERGALNHTNFEEWLGRKILFADANVDHKTWTAFLGSTWGNFENTTSLFRNRPDVTPALTVPLRVSEIGGQTNKVGGPEIIRKELQDTANGLNDDKYRKVAERLVNFGQAKAIIRLGHEMDIEWYPHSIRNGNEDVYISAFRHVVGIFRSYPGNQFLIDYNGNGAFNLSYKSPRTGITQPYGDAGYPGSDYVDIIGVDVYNRGSWSNTKARLDYTLALAKKHGKPMSIPEWGLWVSETGDDPTFIQNMYDWINATPTTGPGRMIYHAYFQDHPEVRLELAPNSRSKFKQLFGQTNTANSPTVTISANPVSIKTGESSTITWSSTNSTSCTASNGWTGTKATSGSMSTSALDSTRTYTLTCTGSGGSATNSVTVNVSAVTGAPDVIIVPGSVTTVPAAPKAGDEVRFSATIKNNGNLATPGGVIHGVAFKLNGSVVAWSDNSTTSLAPGATRTLTSNGGPAGKGTWTAVAGNYTLESIWDDVQRIAESNETNNTNQSSIVVLAAETVPPASSANATVNLSAVPNTLQPGVNTTVDIKVNTGGELIKTARVRITYDASRLDFVSVDDSASAFTGSGIPLYTAPGIVEISRFDIAGKSGSSLDFAKVVLKAKNTAGSTNIVVAPSELYSTQNETPSANLFNSSLSKNTAVNIQVPIVDTIKPTAEISRPNTFTTNNAVEVIRVNATDNVAVDRVVLRYVGGSVIGTDTTAPYDLTLNTKAVPNGNYQIEAIAYDTAGNSTISTPIAIKIRHPDINRSGTIEVGDLSILISSWNQNVAGKQTVIANDLNDDGIIGINDLNILISRWGL